ncbi:unnamed protein product, partial [Ectocarpus sp. 13 AM-2016]
LSRNRGFCKKTRKNLSADETTSALDQLLARSTNLEQYFRPEEEYTRGKDSTPAPQRVGVQKVTD